MSAPVVGRPAESQAVAAFLTAAASGPSGLLVEGDAGIGKTTLLLDTLQQARERGFRVLSAQPSQAESVLAYGSAADLLTDVDQTAWGDLPTPQRRALDGVLLRADGAATNPRTVAAGFLSVVNALADESPVLLAIDDLQWLDTSSRNIVAYVARRLSGRVGVLCCVRTDHDSGNVAYWLQMPRPDAMTRITMSPLRLGGLSRVVSGRLDRSLPRSTMVRIWEVSGGNPLYALELARATGDLTTTSESQLPQTLAELVRARIGDLGVGVQDLLLAAACVAAPTVELVGRATDTDMEHVVELLAEAESKGIVTIKSNRLQFTHPLLARGVYTNASPPQRRAMHRRLAEIVDEPELQARHLALATTSPDPQTLKSLDAAAEMARNRGAPAAAAELLGLALRLGGDTPERRIMLARHHLAAGDTGRARYLLKETIDRLAPGVLRAEASSLLGFVHLFDDSFVEAAGVLERALDEAGDNLALRTRLLITMSYARYNSGRFSAAARSIEDAVTHAERLGQPHELSQALSMRAVLWFLRGDGLDAPSLARALESEDHHADIPMAFRPSMQNAMLLGWNGQLDEAHHTLATIRRRCIERGEENELIFVAVHSVLVEIWRGDFSGATVITEDTMERALQLGGDVALFVAMTARAALAAYAGREEQARRATSEAFAASQRCGANLLVVWPITTLGFLEVSLGNYDAALTILAPLLARLDAAPNATEIPAATFVPDAVEAMVAVDRLAEAEPLVDALERNGSRLDRAWMLAVGARCRAMLLAAHDDIDEASRVVEAAMSHHDRVPMPFERARTQLLLGQLQRQHRQKDAATATLREVVQAFEGMGTALWADRARAELARADVAHSGTVALTPSEQRVAELAATGMTNRDIASALFISPKTVEANLARAYRKLGIRSRTQLSRHITSPDP